MESLPAAKFHVWIIVLLLWNLGLLLASIILVLRLSAASPDAEAIAALCAEKIDARITEHLPPPEPVVETAP